MGPMLVVLVGIFLVQADLFASFVIMPAVQAELGFDGGALQFLFAGFAIAQGALLIASGRLGDLYGAKRLYLLGLVLFVLASLAAASASSLMWLALARTFQGVAAALIQPQVLAILANTYSGDASRRAFALYTFTMGLGCIVGQMLGGVLVSLNVLSLSWRGVSLTMGLAALTCLALGSLFIPRGVRHQAQALDWAGVGFSVVLLSLITTPLTIGQGPWPDGLRMGLLCAAPMVAYAFFRHQVHLGSLGRAQMLPMRLLMGRSTQRDLLAAFIFYLGVASFHVLLMLYLQQARGASALHTALIYSTMAVGFMLASAAAPALGRRMGPSSIALGALALAASHVFNGVSVALGWGLAPLTLAVLCAGVSIGLVMGPLIALALSRVPPQDAGVMSGLVATIQAAANAIGVAVVPLPFVATAAQEASERIAGYVGSLAILVGLAIVVAGFMVRSRG